MSYPFQFNAEFRENSVLYTPPMTSHKLLKQQFQLCYAKYSKKRRRKSWFHIAGRMKQKTSRHNGIMNNALHNSVDNASFNDRTNTYTKVEKNKRHRMHLLRKLNDNSEDGLSFLQKSYLEDETSSTSTSPATQSNASASKNSSSYWSIGRGMSQKRLDDDSHEPPVLDEDPVFNIENVISPEVSSGNFTSSQSLCNTSSVPQYSKCTANTSNVCSTQPSTNESDDDGDDLIIVSEVDQNLKLSFWDIKRVVKCMY